MGSKMKGKVGENLSNSSDNNGNKAVIVRVKRKADQSPLEAFCMFSTTFIFVFSRLLIVDLLN